MTKIYDINDFTLDSFIHGTIEKFYYDYNSKIFELVFSYLNLTQGGCVYECTITVTNWWNLEVLHYRGQELINTLRGADIPELDSVVDFTYDGDILVLKDICGRDEIYHFIFTRPTIQITGEYDPD